MSSVYPVYEDCAQLGDGIQHVHASFRGTRCREVIYWPPFITLTSKQEIDLFNVSDSQKRCAGNSRTHRKNLCDILISIQGVL